MSTIATPPVSRLPNRRPLRTALLLGGLAAAFSLLIYAGGLFEQIQLLFTNLLYTDSPRSSQVVIVAIDDQSLGAYGRSVASWPRTLHADLLDRLSGAGARVVAFDILFDLPTSADDAFAGAITRARTSSAGTRTVLAVASDVSTTYPDRHAMLIPAAPLRLAALGHVDVSADPDGAVRWQPLHVEAANVDYLALSAATYLSYLRIPPGSFAQVVKFSPTRVTLTAQRVIPVDAAARMLINFFGAPGTYPIYSYRAVHDGEIDPAVFKGKIVLVGALGATGVTDSYFVPIARGSPMSGVEIQANALDTLIENQPLVAETPGAQIAVILIAALVGSAFMTRLRWYQTLAVYGFTLIGSFLAASVAFSLAHTVIQLFHPVLTLTCVATGALIISIIREARYRQMVQTLLATATQLSEQRLILIDTLDNVATDVQRLLGCASASIWLWDDDQRRLLAVYNPSLIADTKANAAFESRELLIERDRLFAPLSLHRNAPGKPIGVVAALQPSAHRFDPQQVTLFRMLADQVAPALENSRLYTRQVQQTDLLEAILISTPDPILVLDAAHRLIRTNEAARALFRLESSDAQSLRAILSSAGVEADLIEGMLKALSTGESQRDVAIGAQSFLMRTAPLQRAQTGWVIGLNDVSLLKEFDALKTQMVRMASHDLRNPLGIITGFTDVLLTDKSATALAADQRYYVQLIDEAAQRMLAIISDLLNIERLKAGRLDRESFELGALIEQVVGEYRAGAESHAQILRFEHTIDLIMLNADPVQLREAFGNLLNNATRYTPDGGSITVSLSMREQNAMVAVSDTGYGIPKAAHAKLFTAFYRVPSPTTAKLAGTGLGLSLVKATVEAHGGTIQFESDEGRGSTFRVTLPL